SLGELAYFRNPPGRDGGPPSSTDDADVCTSLELLLRSSSSEDIPQRVSQLAAQGREPGSWLRTLDRVINAASLSPWTQFVPCALAFGRALVQMRLATSAELADFLAKLGRRL